MRIRPSAIIFSLCCLLFSLVVFTSGASLENAKPKPSSSSMQLFEGLLKYLKTVDERNQKVEKSLEELSEQVKSLSRNVNEIKSKISKSSNHNAPLHDAPKDQGYSSLPDLRLIKSCNDNQPKEQFSVFEYSNPTNDPAIKNVVCSFITEEGGWTIIQKRVGGPREDFYRGWADYVKGFGTVDGNFWLGLDNIYALTKNGDQELQIELEDFKGDTKYAKYSWFSIADASVSYQLSIGGFSGNAGDSMTNFQLTLNNGMRFSTKDKDNDNKADENCAVRYPGGWWYANDCGWSLLNGFYREKGETFPTWGGIYWHTWTGGNYSVAKTKMKIRKRT